MEQATRASVAAREAVVPSCLIEQARSLTPPLALDVAHYPKHERVALVSDLDYEPDNGLFSDTGIQTTSLFKNHIDHSGTFNLTVYVEHLEGESFDVKDVGAALAGEPGAGSHRMFFTSTNVSQPNATAAEFITFMKKVGTRATAQEHPHHDHAE